jgi:DNA-binding response OmpR family regulator
MNDTTNLLIVDDDERICRMLGRFLKREGYKVRTAADGEIMWQILAKTLPELIILDLMLPGDDGITLARELRVKYPTIGIIILTAKNDVTDTVMGLKVGADDYLTKPFDNAVLLARIRCLLRRLFVYNDHGSQVHYSDLNQ